MAGVIGIGGIFFKSADPKALYDWYGTHLGMNQEGGTVLFRWKDSSNNEQMTVWSLFPMTSRYFDPSKQPFMINYIVEDLAALLPKLRAEGVKVDDKHDESEYGKFGWIEDPEGNRIELWEPPAKKDS